MPNKLKIGDRVIYTGEGDVMTKAENGMIGIVTDGLQGDWTDRINVRFEHTSHNYYPLVCDLKPFPYTNVSRSPSTKVEPSISDSYFTTDMCGKIREFYLNPSKATGLLNQEFPINNQSIIKRTMNYFKKSLLSADDKTLIKAGFLNDDLELTNKGGKALQFIHLQAKKKELVEMAVESIEEDKEAF